MDCAGSLNGKGRNVQAGGLLPVAEYAPKSAKVDLRASALFGAKLLTMIPVAGRAGCS